MQLRSIFHETVSRKKLKVWKFQSYMLSCFSAIKKTVTGVEGGGVHINFQYKFNSHNSLVLITANSLSSIALFIFFSSASSLLFFQLFFIHLMTMNK